MWFRAVTRGGLDPVTVPLGACFPPTESASCWAAVRFTVTEQMDSTESSTWPRWVSSIPPGLGAEASAPGSWTWDLEESMQAPAGVLRTTTSSTRER